MYIKIITYLFDLINKFSIEDLNYHETTKNLNKEENNLKNIFDKYVMNKKVIDYDYNNQELNIIEYNHKNTLLGEESFLYQVDEMFLDKLNDIFHDKTRLLLKSSYLYKEIKKLIETYNNKITIEEEKIKVNKKDLLKDIVLNLNNNKENLLDTFEAISLDYELDIIVEIKEEYQKTKEKIKREIKVDKTIEESYDIDFVDISEIKNLDYKTITDFLLSKKIISSDDELNSKEVVKILQDIEDENINLNKALLEIKEQFLKDFFNTNEADLKDLYSSIKILTKDELNSFIEQYVELSNSGANFQPLPFNFLMRMIVNIKLDEFENFVLKKLNKENKLDSGLKDKLDDIIEELKDKFEIQEGKIDTLNPFLDGISNKEKWNNEKLYNKFKKIYGNELGLNKNIKNIKISEQIKELIGQNFIKMIKENFKTNEELIKEISSMNSIDFIEQNKDLNNKYIRKLLINIGNKVFRKEGIKVKNKKYLNYFDFLNKNNNNTESRKVLKEILEIKSYPNFQLHLKKFFNIDLKNSHINYFIDSLNQNLKELLEQYGENVLINSEDPLVELFKTLLKEQKNSVVALTDVRTLNEIKNVVEKDEKTDLVVLIPSENNKIMKNKLKTKDIKEILENTNDLSLKELIDKIKSSGKIMSLEELNYLLPNYLLNKKLYKENKWALELEKILKNFNVTVLNSERKDRNLLIKNIDKLNEKLSNKFILLGPSGVGKDTVLEILKEINKNPKLNFENFNKAEKIIEKYVSETSNINYLSKYSKIAYIKGEIDTPIENEVKFLLSINTFVKKFVQTKNQKLEQKPTIEYN